MTINEKIREIRNVFCDGDNSLFAKILGVSTQYASNICANGKNVGEKQKQHILEIFPNINKSWLLADEGGMLKSDTTPSSPQANADSVSMPRDVWEVIRDQAASLKAKDNQVSELIGILRKEVSKKGEGVGAINPVARQAAEE